MKRTSLLAVAGVLAVAACQDQPTQPKVIAPSRTVVRGDPSVPPPKFNYLLSQGRLTLMWNWGDDQPWDLVSFDLTVDGHAIAGDWNIKPYAANAAGGFERYGFSWSGTGFQSVPQACVSVMAKSKSGKGTPTTTYHAQNCEPVEPSMEDVSPPSPTQIATGAHFSCALATSGEAYCWGYNGYGQLGDGTTTSRNSAWPVAGGFIFRQISADGWSNAGYTGWPGHACGITAAGVAYCWGHNGNGQLGDGTNVDRHVPVPVAGGLLFAQISVGAASTCGVTTTGDGYCWGWNYYGQLGDGTSSGRWTPTRVAGGLKFVQISTGGGLEVYLEAHTCGVTTTGAAYCWGGNDWGEMGNGTWSDGANPSPVAVLGGLTFQQISAGSDHTCGVTTSNAAYCWGSSGQGQLGDGSWGGPRTSPQPVAGGLSFARISAGRHFTCGLSRTSGAYCWGENELGKLGAWGDNYVATPIQVIGPIGGTQISTGETHACAVNVLGQAYCWGGGAFGELGTGTSYPGYQSMTPARVRANPAFRQLSAGYQHVCGLDGADEAYCWGNTTVTGQPGDGTIAASLESGLRFTQVSAGAHHTCGLTGNGSAFCWGLNTYGQLGDGTTTDRTWLKPIPGFTFSQVDAGGEYTCGVTAAGAAYCWGSNDAGQLGDGTTTDRHVPTLVPGGYDFRKISAGKQITCTLDASGQAYCWGSTGIEHHVPFPVENGPAFMELTTGDRFACGLTSAGAAYCWGVNDGRLGDGTTSAQLFPTAVVGGLTFSQISAGFYHACAVTGPGAPYCWGWNLWGQNGDGTTTTSLVPTPVSGGLTFDKIVGGGDFSCGRATTGVTYCWGANAYGQLGDGTTTAHLTPALVIGWLNVRT